MQSINIILKMSKSEPSLRNETIKSQNLSQNMRFYQLQDSNNQQSQTNNTSTRDLLQSQEQKIKNEISEIFENAIKGLRINEKLNSIDRIKEKTIAFLKIILKKEKRLVDQEKIILDYVEGQLKKIPIEFQLIHQQIEGAKRLFKQEILIVKKRINKIQFYLHISLPQQKSKIKRSESFAFKRFYSRERHKVQQNQLKIKYKQTERSSSERKEARMDGISEKKKISQLKLYQDCQDKKSHKK